MSSGSGHQGVCPGLDTDTRAAERGAQVQVYSGDKTQELRSSLEGLTEETPLAWGVAAEVVVSRAFVCLVGLGLGSGSSAWLGRGVHLVCLHGWEGATIWLVCYLLPPGWSPDPPTGGGA